MTIFCHAIVHGVIKSLRCHEIESHYSFTETDETATFFLKYLQN